jgi:hypothetical protein
MRIALQNSWPNAPHSAEAEWIRRALVALNRLGHDAVEVITSDDIFRASPDCVLVTHEYTPKLTSFPTLGLMWSPPAFFADDPIRQKSLLSLDGYLCGSRNVAQWIDDFVTGFGVRPLIHEGLVLPSTQDCGPSSGLPSQLSIFYAGVHWDGSRHGRVFEELDGRVPLSIHGPAGAWAKHAQSYRGMLPFDGTSVIDAIRSAGVALCLHKSAHREANCPSMRLFEAAAAGALIITDDFGFPREWFRESVLYVDAELPPKFVVEQIMEHINWAQKNREAAERLARRSNEIFRNSLALENMFYSLPDFVDRVRGSRGMMSVAPSEGRGLPTVEYMMRVGLHGQETVARALESLAGQTYPNIALTIVQFHPLDLIEDLIERYRSRFQWIRHVIVSNNGKRSTSWAAGIRSLSADFFGVLDDDDTLFPNHVSSIMSKFEDDPSLGFVYSGLIRVEDEPGHYFYAPQFAGPGGKLIEERRELFCLTEETFDELLPTQNVISANSWICRRSNLHHDAMRDSGSDLSEDVYFVALMATRARFGFTGQATALWHWRSTSKDNWTLSHPTEKAKTNLARWRGRARGLKLPKNNRVPPPSQWYDVDEVVARDRK